MMKNIFDLLIEKQTSIEYGEYEECVFVNCDFSNADFASYVFSDCEFRNCNLSLINIANTAFKKVKFEECKLVGVRFDRADDLLFTVYFKNCQLNYASFYKKNMKKTFFISSNLEETDFTEATLSEAKFSESNLSQAVFYQTNLEKADFLTAKNYVIDPSQNYLKKAKFSIDGVLGLLTMFDIIVK